MLQNIREVLIVEKQFSRIPEIIVVGRSQSNYHSEFESFEPRIDIQFHWSPRAWDEGGFICKKKNRGVELARAPICMVMHSGT